MEKYREQELKYLLDLEALSKGKTLIELKNNTANPSAAGLVGFGLAHLAYDIANCQAYELDAMVCSVIFFLGGILEIIAGVMEQKRSNYFNAVFFLGYGFLWLSTCFTIFMPYSGLMWPVTGMSWGYFMLGWTLFTFCLLVASFKMAPVIYILIFSMAFISWLLIALHMFITPGNLRLLISGGAFGIAAGLLALYAAFGKIWNEVYMRNLLP
jgi:succinate-acetate transporter protein